VAVAPSDFPDQRGHFSTKVAVALAMASWQWPVASLPNKPESFKNPDNDLQPVTATPIPTATPPQWYHSKARLRAVIPTPQPQRATATRGCGSAWQWHYPPQKSKKKKTYIREIGVRAPFSYRKKPLFRPKTEFDSMRAGKNAKIDGRNPGLKAQNPPNLRFFKGKWVFLIGKWAFLGVN
jgi:hypothetical protein